MEKAVFLDRDGTINIEKNYLYKIEDFTYLYGVKEGLLLLEKMGYLLIIITNQSGIARGYYTETDYLKLNEWMLKDLERSGIHITDSLYCPHHPDAKVSIYRKRCECRKPGKELFERAIRKYDIDITKSYAMGDKMRDLTMCRGNMEMQGFLLYTKTKEERNIHCIRGGIIEAASCIAEWKNETMD